MIYAARTETSVEKTKADIERLLLKHGAVGILNAWSKERGKATIQFELSDRVVRFVLPLPQPNETQFYILPQGRGRRSPKAAEEKWEQACRERWRALFLVIKGKLEAAATGIETFEESFLSHIVMPDTGRTVWESVRDPIKLTYSGRVDVPLLGVGDGSR